MHLMSIASVRSEADVRHRPHRIEGEARMGKLDGKTALITGGSRGLGLAAAKRFVDEGAYVFITGRREAELASAAKDIGKNVKALKGDVSNLDDLDRIIAQLKEIKAN